MAGYGYSIPANVTPFTPGGLEVDLDWFPKHLAYLKRWGADGVLAMGTNGEGPSLAMADRKAIVDVVMAHHGSLVVLAGTGCAAMPDTIEISRYALDRGVDAIMVVPPFYFKDLTPRGLAEYYRTLMRSIPSDGKVFLYNIPAVSGVEISDELVDVLVAEFPSQIVGIKDTSGDIDRTRRYVERYPGLAIYSGNDFLVAGSLRVGSTGAISAAANVFPDLVGDVCRAFREGGDVDKAQERLTKVRDLFKKYPNRSFTKHLLHIVGGLALTHVRPPLTELTPEQVEELRRDADALVATLGAVRA